MSDERLRFIIEMQNKASAELRKLSTEMKGVKETSGMVSTANWFQKLESVSGSTTKTLRPLVGGLNMVGVSGLAAGLSVAGLVSQFRDLAKSMPALQELSRQTGISKTELERLKQTASNLNIDPSKMTAGISAFSAEMVQFSKQTGELYAEMSNGSAGLARKIAAEWKDHPEEALKDYLGWLAEIPEANKRAGKSAQEGVQIQRYWAQKGLGDADLAQLVGKGMGGFREAYQQAAQDVGQITDELVKQAEAFDRSITRFDRSWTNLKNDLGATVLPALTATTDGMRALFDELKHDPELIGIGAASLGALYARRRLMRAAGGGGGGGISPATAAKVEGAAIEQKSASASFAEAVAEFRAGVREMNAKGSASGNGAPVKEAEKDGGNFASKLKGALPMLATAGAIAGAGAFVTYEILNRDQSKSLVDGGRPDVEPQDNNLGLPGVEPEKDFPSGTSGAAAGFHPDDDRLSRARASDAPDRSLDGFVVGSLDKPITHLVGTLKTAAAAVDGNVRPAAFHPAGLATGVPTALDPQALITAGVKEGVLSAFREWAGLKDMDAKGGGGFMPASFGGGGGSAGGAGGYSPSAAGRPANLRYGRQHEGTPYDDGGATPTGAHTPLKDLIAAHETGGTGAASYDTVYGHAEQPNSKMHALAPPKPITQMTIGEVLAYQREMKPRAHSPAFPVGRAQWVEHTLRGLTRGMDQNQLFTPELQEKLFDRSIAGRMGQGVGGFRSEWDSLRHVDSGTIQGAIEGHRAAMAKGAPTANTTPSGPPGAKGYYPAWMDPKSQREMAGINSPLARDLLAAAQETGTHFRILQGLRSEAEAAANARKHTGVRNSQHRWGAAADIKLTDANGRDLDRNDPAYERYAKAYEAASRAHGGNGRWLGHVPGWQWDRAHFDQGIGYGQSHPRDPYGVGGPTPADVKAGSFEIFRGPDNPFTRAAKPMSDAADKLKAAVAPLPPVKPEPPRMDATGGQRVQMDPLHVHLTHREDGRTRIAVKHGEGVRVTMRTAPTMVQTA